MTVDTSLTAILGMGFLLGLRHATDADHVAAVSTFVGRDGSLIRSCLVGTWWGAGHTLALLVAGLGTITFKLSVSPAMERAFETAVALALILLGGNVLLRALAPMHRHREPLDRGGRPFVVGLLHGLAGSATLTLLVLATVPSPLAGLLYIAVFGAGSTAGMLLLSGLIAVPFVMTARRSERWHTIIRAMAGAASLVLGVWLMSTSGT